MTIKDYGTMSTCKTAAYSYICSANDHLRRALIRTVSAFAVILASALLIFTSFNGDISTLTVTQNRSIWSFSGNQNHVAMNNQPLNIANHSSDVANKDGSNYIIRPQNTAATLNYTNNVTEISEINTTIISVNNVINEDQPGTAVANNVINDLSDNQRAKSNNNDSKAKQNQNNLAEKIESNSGNSNSDGYIIPLLTSHVGDNNQLMEYMTAAIIARATNRTLCLTPFFPGPAKHGHGDGWKRKGLAFEDRYDISVLSRFVKISNEPKCMQACSKTFDSFWWLKASTPSRIQHWTWLNNVTTRNLNWDFVRWTSEEDIRKALLIRNNGGNNEVEQCVALGGLFPGLRWRGAYLAISAYLEASQSIKQAASNVLSQAMDNTLHHPFLAVHWRFHEANCPEEDLGLCFLRCPDGSVIDSGLLPYNISTEGFLPTWRQILSKSNNTIDESCTKGHYHVVGLTTTKDNLISAIQDKALSQNVSHIHLATDGWMRGDHGKALVSEVVTTLRQSGLNVFGLWSDVEGLPNFQNGVFFDHKKPNTRRLRSNRPNQHENPIEKEKNKYFTVTSHSISQIEQEICSRASSFLGSGESTWSLTVFRSRMALRRHNQLKADIQKSTMLTTSSSGQSLQASTGINNIIISNKNKSNDVFLDDNQVIQSLMDDHHAAGMQCQYQLFFNKARIKAPRETFEDEAPDGWLDVETCEGRSIKGLGSCKVTCY